MLVIIILNKNNNGILCTKGVKVATIANAPNPYIGQNGPFKKPLFTNCFCKTEQYVVSQHQPIKL
ncbi:conserved hypothetical protein [Clostridioides difficile CD002]|nr:hypothetical protein HMPREF1123_00597 [Clostridioides difficile 050-P50-2011]EHJ33231.1 hypothetical protein HMPREF1122_00726 [Clostridioides difficile 002-P50-2011]CCL03187.1 conserved hypothetical protein [Clostridioides difficile E13]CCL08181.1 conserved hypothetical protein [Clostridioides difficile CD002]